MLYLKKNMISNKYKIFQNSTYQFLNHYSNVGQDSKFS